MLTLYRAIKKSTWAHDARPSETPMRGACNVPTKASAVKSVARLKSSLLLEVLLPQRRPAANACRHASMASSVAAGVAKLSAVVNSRSCAKRSSRRASRVRTACTERSTAASQA